MSSVGARWIGAIVVLAACAPGVKPVTVAPETLPSLEAERAKNPNDRQLAVRLGAAYYRAGQFRQAVDVLKAGVAVQPSFSGAVFLGLSREGLGQLDSAETAYRIAAGLDLDRAQRAELDARLVNLTREQLKVAARRAVAQEAAITRSGPTPNAVAVLPWRYLGTNQELAPLEKGIAHLILTDLSKVTSLRLVEREQLRAVTDEIALAAAQRTDPATAARSGRLVRAARIVQGSLRDEARGGNLRLDANVVATQTGAITARGTATDRLAQLFAMEKEVVLELLQQLRITLSAAERRAIMERPTSDLQAFLAFSRGLEAEDRGDLKGAVQQYDAAVARDPNFRAAKDRSAAAGQAEAAGQRTPTQLAGMAGQSLPPGSRQPPPPGGPPPSVTPTPGRSMALQNAIEIVAPSTGARINRRTLARTPLQPRLPEALRQDDPTQIGGRGEIIIVIPRP